jgi:hypothetical protein
LISKLKENKVWNIGSELQTSTLVLLYGCLTNICSGGNSSEWFNKNNEFKYGNNSVVDIEADCEKKTIHYFINKNQCPYYISYISSSSFPLLFGFSSKYSPIVEVISLFKIFSSSSYINSSFECKPIKWVLFFLFY